MSSIIEVLRHFLIISFISVVLLAITLSFLVRFVRPALNIRKELQAALDGLKGIKAAAKGPLADLEAVSRAVSTNDTLRGSWQEFGETLHGQRTPGTPGQAGSVRWRSTTLAETFFTEQALVDTPLKTEFHKHLPGILTGLGIIGTFSGLITGLIRFEVSGDAERIRASLNGLIQSVGYSFAVSAMAITLAMVFIWVEKSLLSACYRRVEGLCRVIDSLFDAGAGEEYLARLVASSENSAARIEEIKNSLAGELKQVLTGVLTQHAKTSAMLNRQLLSGIGESIRPHVETIARAVEHRDATPAEAIASSVNQVLDSFTARMQDIVGSQFHEMAGVLKDTSRTMESAALQVGRCVELMQTAGRGTEEAMARRMDLAITSLDERQRIMDRSMGEFVAQTSRVAGSQTDAVRDVQSMLADLGERMTLMVDRIEAGSRLAAETTREGTEHLALMTRESSELFHAGRDALQRSFADFTEASGTMGATLQAIQKASGGLQGASSNLATATHGVKDMLEEHRRTSEIFAAIVAELRATIENARHEASMTTEIVERIRQATGQLGLAQNKAGEYLHALTEVLAQAHAEFAGNIEQTLRRSNTQFHEELSRAVSLVSGAIQDFGDVLDAVSTKEEKRCWV